MTDSVPLIKRSLVDQALEQLRLRIAQGVWAVGERLPTEPELSAELGISRNTVREAMRVLAFSGLIEIRQGDGSYLRSMTDPLGAMRALSHCTLAQAQETRQILEVEAIGLAAQRRTEQDLQGLHQALRTSAALYHGDLEAYIHADLVFHTRLVDAAHNPALSELYQYFFPPSSAPSCARPSVFHHAARRCSTCTAPCLKRWSSKTRNAPNPSADS